MRIANIIERCAYKHPNHIFNIDIINKYANIEILLLVFAYIVR